MGEDQLNQELLSARGSVVLLMKICGLEQTKPRSCVAALDLWGKGRLSLVELELPGLIYFQPQRQLLRLSVASLEDLPQPAALVLPEVIAQQFHRRALDAAARARRCDLPSGDQVAPAQRAGGQHVLQPGQCGRVAARQKTMTASRVSSLACGIEYLAFTQGGTDDGADDITASLSLLWRDQDDVLWHVDIV